MRVVEIHSKKKAFSETEKAKAADLLKKMRKEGEKMIKGMFEFIDAQGGWLDFSYRFYPGEPIRTVRINHGEVCDLPMDLVRHLNNVYKKVRTPPANNNEDQSPMKSTKNMTKFSRCRFTPMDVLAPGIIAA